MEVLKIFIKNSTRSQSKLHICYLAAPKTSIVPLKRQIQSPGVNCCAITNATQRPLEASSQSWVLKASRRGNFQF